MPALTQKGQVTVPKRMRDHLGLKPGDDVAFQMNERGEVVVLPATQRESDTDRFAAIRGRFKFNMSTEELMRLTRGDDWGR